MADSMTEMAERAYELESLHAAEYTKTKRNLHGIVAAGGCAAVVGIALLSPWVWPALWAAGSAWVGTNGTAALALAATGATTSGLCGYQSIQNHRQCNLRENSTFL